MYSRRVVEGIKLKKCSVLIGMLSSNAGCIITVVFLIVSFY